MPSPRDGQFQIQTLPIVGPYNTQRFRQFSPEDAANWYVMSGESTKRSHSMFPTMGRAHLHYLGINKLIFGTQPRGIFKTIKYAYVVDGNAIYQIDTSFNQTIINADPAKALLTIAGDLYFTYLVASNIVFACFVDSEKIYIYREDTGDFEIVTDPNAPGNNGNGKPGFIAAFGNRIAVSIAESSEFVLSQINLGGSGFDPATCFTVNGQQVFAQEDGIIRQMGVLNNTLYIFCDFITGVWNNIASRSDTSGVIFPWKHNSTYNWNFGIASPTTLDIDFGYIAFLAQNSDGLLQFMYSNGGQPEKMSTEAIDVLLQNYTNNFGANNPFTSKNTSGFLYQYENTIFYRVSGGDFVNYQILDQEQNANSIEFKFDTKTWHRCIELNGNRNRIIEHIYFNTKHLVTVLGENTIYEMSGKYYFNEVANPNQPDQQADDAYIAYPFRYERITPIISEDDYAEFETEYVEIDFVFGDSNIVYWTGPYANTKFIISEQAGSDGQPQYLISEQNGADGQPQLLITEDSNTPQLDDNIYNDIYKPHIELYWSDDGGISFYPADVREFSQMGQYQWRMRWYQLGASRNRVYKLIAVSPVPIVILGGVMNVRRISGGAN